MNPQDYIKAVEKALSLGNATEHTHRPALKDFVESLENGITATNEPKHVKCGAPDYIVTKGETPLGYIEAKDVGKPLDKEEKSDQMKRYLEGLSNLILTDYLEFRWYVNGKHRLTARLADVSSTKKLKTAKNGATEVTELLTAFLNAQVPTLANSKELAVKMAAIARLIREAINKAFKQETKSGSLHQQFRGFQKVLLHDLTEEQFSDMYAQTICYGLFAARCNMKGSATFTREHAAFNLPKTNPFLRKLFGHIAGPDLHESIVWAVDDLAELLNRADINEILRDFGKRTGREDPVVHFYETFLVAYDPKIRETRGVYYTPEPVVSYIVRSVDHILKKDFGLIDGLADSSKIQIKDPHGKGKIETHKVLILDPATGTGTFLYEVINRIFDSFKKNKGMWSGYVSEHLLPRLFGFELLMAPYAVAHLKLGLQLDETGYDFKNDERLRVYLTNSLDEVLQLKSDDPFSHWIIDEANAASEIKQDAPVMVILGNPPYSGHSINKGKWIINLLHGMDTHSGKKSSNYFEVDGEPLGERNPKWLNNDYIKFIRFAQWRIEQTGYGILAFITDNSYLDGVTMRGMRQGLMQTFDDIYLLDLHGNTNKKERSPNDGKDENVFDIQQGVSISLFIKRKSNKSQLAKVHHAHLWGVREIYDENVQDKPLLAGGKYHWLWQNDVSTTVWKELKPQTPFYLFIPQDTDLRAEYERYWKVTEIFPVNNTGVITSRDKFVLGFNEEEVSRRITDFRTLEFEEAKAKYHLGDVRERTLRQSWIMVREMEEPKQYLTQMLYRPFDKRWLFYHHSLVRWPVYAIMKHLMAGNNRGFITRITKDKWDCLACSSVMGHKALAAYDVNYLFPLYLYPEIQKTSLFDDNEPTDAPGGRRPNLSPDFVGYSADCLKLKYIEEGRGDLQITFSPEDIFNYMYAVFHSLTYRSRYAAFLKIDYPRLPFTSKPGLFRALCYLGSDLVGLHLMEKHAPVITGYPIPGDNTVEAVRYTEPKEGAEQGRVWINKTQYFEGVPPEVWAFHVGGYQVCQKWLKDRKGRQLTYDDLTHYQRIVSTLSETIRLMEEIDEAIEDHGGWPIQ
jgi:predicted helicase